MGDMLSTAVSGLLAFQTALDTTSNNISNVDTAGYNKEVTNFATATPTVTSVGDIGNGVQVAGVTNEYNAFLAAQTNSATSGYQQFSTLSSLASNIDNLLANTNSGLSATLQGFSNAVQTLANDPSSTSSRQAVLTQAQSVISQLQGYQGSLNTLQQQVTSQVGAQASTITSFGGQIASLNNQIVAAEHNGTGVAPNALLDQQQQLISQLSQSVNITTTTESDGATDVFIGSGQPLVVGSNASTVASTADQFDSGRPQISLQTSAGSVDITSSISGGTLGGLLQFQEQMLTPAQNSLGQAAVTLTTLVNQQNQQGLDLDGNPGQALMSVGGAQVLASSSNAGTASVTATISDVGSLTTSNYYLQYDGAHWNLIDTSSGASTAVSSSVSGGVTTLTGAGLTMTVSGTAQAGDRFLVEPTANAVQGLAMTTSDPARIAAAGPLVTSASATNTGTASMQSATVPNLSAWTPGNYTLSFGAGSAYTVTNAGGATVATGTYTSGAPISFDGIDVTLTGVPASGDSFAINYNANGAGDNSNALKLANILNVKVLNGATESLSQAVASFVGTVGTQTSQAQNGAAAQQSAMQSAQTAQQSVSGVNLDEEAANMLKYEQAYQAAAQIISTSQSLFTSLLSAVQAG